MRCPDCNKFTGVDADTDPEVDLDIDDDGRVTGTVGIVNNCADCGTELRRTDFDIDIEPSDEVEAHLKACHPDGDDINLSVEGEAERTSRFQRTGGGGRGRTYYGFALNFTVTCGCGKDSDVEGNVTDSDFSSTGDASDEVKASEMEEC